MVPPTNGGVSTELLGVFVTLGHCCCCCWTLLFLYKYYCWGGWTCHLSSRRGQTPTFFKNFHFVSTSAWPPLAERFVVVAFFSSKTYGFEWDCLFFLKTALAKTIAFESCMSKALAKWYVLSWNLQESLPKWTQIWLPFNILTRVLIILRIYFLGLYPSFCMEPLNIA